MPRLVSSRGTGQRGRWPCPAPATHLSAAASAKPALTRWGLLLTPSLDSWLSLFAELFQLMKIMNAFIFIKSVSMNLQLGVGEEPKRYYSTLPGPIRGKERDGAPSSRKKEDGSQGGVRHSLYQSPHLLLLQGYNRQVRTGRMSVRCIRNPCSLCFNYFDCLVFCRTAWFTCWTESSTLSVKKLHQLAQTSVSFLLTSSLSTAAYAEFPHPVGMPTITTRGKIWQRVSVSVLPLSLCSMPQFWWTFLAASEQLRCDMATFSPLAHITSFCTRTLQVPSPCLLKPWHACAHWGSFMTQGGKKEKMGHRLVKCVVLCWRTEPCRCWVSRLLDAASNPTW